MFRFMKLVKVTNNKNVLVQVPRVVALDWELKIGDKLEVRYEEDKLTIRPAVQGRGGATE